MVQYRRTDTMDPELTRQRSLVLIATPQKNSEWKEIAEYTHKSFRLMGIDAVNYMHYLDYQANPTVKQGIDQYADTRQVAFTILIEKRPSDYRMVILPRTGKLNEAWYTEGPDVRTLIRNLAITLKRTDHVNQNFLISVKPEFLSSLPLYEGTRYPNFPDRIKRLRMAVLEIPEVMMDTSFSIQQRQEIEKYNQMVRDKNASIKKLAEAYPFTLHVLKLQDEKELYRQGYQYVLYYLHSSVESIREILDYESQKQKEYISQLTLSNGQRTLQSYPADETVYKWYIKQTAVSDIHVGRYWDAHDNFELSLQYVLNRIVELLGE